jgi:predicted O-methyltransferase YrrM
MYISCAAPQSRVLTLEGCAVIAEKAISSFKALGITNIEMSQGHFDHTFSKAVESFDRIDFVFLDGNHRRGSTLQYFNELLPKLHAESILIVDDINWSPGMTGAWKEICNHEKVSITIDLFRLGIVLFKEDIAKENFVLRF